MEEALREQGYLTWNRGYPSTQYDIETLTDMTLPVALRFLKDTILIKRSFCGSKSVV